MEFNYDIEDFSTGDNSKLYEYLERNLGERLKEIFSQDKDKQDIQKRGKNMNFACPYCKDSRRDSKKKRGWLYFKSFIFFKCFNCNTVKNLHSFVKDFSLEKDINLSFLKKVDSSLLTSTTYSSSSSSAPLYDIEKYLPTLSEFFKLTSGIYPVDHDVEVLKYLKSRYILSLPLENFATDRFHNLYVLNLQRSENRILSFQVRYKEPYNGIRWRSFSYGMLNEKFYHKEIPDEILERLNYASKFYNILNIDPYQDVFITESAICSTHFPNGMASQGTGNIIKLPTGLYIPDNTTLDSAGNKLSIQLMNENLRVFLWRKFLSDHPELSNCKDINEIVIKQGGKWDFRKLLPYFSQDSFDYFYL